MAALAANHHWPAIPLCPFTKAYHSQKIVRPEAMRNMAGNDDKCIYHLGRVGLKFLDRYGDVRVAVQPKADHNCADAMLSAALGGRQPNLSVSSRLTP